MGFFQCFTLFVALDHFCMGKTPKISHSLLPNPTEMLATQANFLISMGYQTLCVTTIYVTPALPTAMYKQTIPYLPFKVVIIFKYECLIIGTNESRNIEFKIEAATSRLQSARCE